MGEDSPWRNVSENDVRTQDQKEKGEQQTGRKLAVRHVIVAQLVGRVLAPEADDGGQDETDDGCSKRDGCGVSQRPAD